MNGITAVVLAGTRPGGDPLAEHAGVSHKALIGIGDRTMIECVVDALAGVERVGRIAIVIDRPEILAELPGLTSKWARIDVLPSASGPSASVAVALERLGTPLLVTTADHPLLRPEWIDRFLDACPEEADAAAGMARDVAVMAAVPGTRRTWLRFADGRFSGCNLFLFRRPAAAGVVRLWQTIEAERKHPFRMLRRLGFGYALRYALGLLRSDRATARLGVLAGGAKVAIVEMDDGRAAVDVDKPEDLELVRRLAATGG